MAAIDGPEAHYEVSGPRLDISGMLKMRGLLAHYNLELTEREEERILLPPTPFDEIGTDTRWLVREHFTDFRNYIAPYFAVGIEGIAFNSLIEIRSPKEVKAAGVWDNTAQRFISPAPKHHNLLVIAERRSAGITTYRPPRRTTHLSQFAIATGGLPVVANRLRSVVNAENHKRFLIELFEFVNDKIRSPRT